MGTQLDIVQGANFIKDVPMTLHNNDALPAILATYLRGSDQPLTLEGPFASTAPLMNNILRTTITMQGSPDQTAIAGLIDDHMLGGWSDSSGNKIRGARAAMYNALDLPIVVTNL